MTQITLPLQSKKALVATPKLFSSSTPESLESLESLESMKDRLAHSLILSYVSVAMSSDSNKRITTWWKNIKI